MNRTRYFLLTARAFWELTRYDLLRITAGFEYLHRSVERQKTASPRKNGVTDALVCGAVTLASCFYYKPVLCLQRSVVAARLLRKSGIAGQLVIGYRPSPFFSHAWVEVDGRVVNDSQGYKQRLQVLSRV